ncbi:MAG: helix-turn-helix domain-containing protein [Nanoarchaeota archaeon]
MEEKTFAIYPSDKKDYDLKIVPDIADGKLLTVFCSFTFITPNYSILFTLEQLRKFASSGNYQVHIVLWDMNILANPYFEKLYSLKKIAHPSSFIDDKVQEIKAITSSMGFNKEKVLVYKSSDLWKRLISYKDDDLFQEFYSILAQMKTTSFHVSGDKISHMIQIPMDIFFCNHFHKLYPEDVERPIDLVFFGENKEELYLACRELMISKRIVQHKNPLFILMKNIPYLLFNNITPEWNMSLREIKDIVVGCNPSKKDLFTLLSHLDEISGFVRIKKKGYNQDLEYSSFYKEYKNILTEELFQILADNLYLFFQDRKKKYLKATGEIEETILNLSKKNDVQEMGSILKSTIALDILLKADGTRTTTDIAKELNKSIATISTYANDLKKMKLIRVLPEGKLKRNIKGVKINLELGI